MRRVIDAFSQALKGMWRNRVVTFVSIFVLTSCLIFVGSFALISTNIDYNLDSIVNLNEIEVFLQYETDDVTAELTRSKIAALPNVTNTVLVSKEQGLEEMKNEFKNYASLFDNIEPGDNPLSHKIRVMYGDNTDVANLVFELEKMKADGVVREVKARLDIAASVESLQNGISMVFIWFALLCAVVCMFVIINTIKLSVYSRREEITIMRYIGASRTYISAPFVLEGAFIGAIGATAAFFIEKLIYAKLMDFVAEKMGFVKLYEFAALESNLLIVFFGVAIFCGVVGSLVSLGKYVEV
ncbi:MAG: permease-like cell division protein FtsX [Clostridia bacterium]|nr:permease-like cell division protein FtsX [Clostridia bacterium]